MVTLPPLILLVLLGPIIARAQSAGSPHALRWPVGAVATLVALVATINFQAGLLPWYQYGQMKEALAARLRTAFRRDDFFISSESGIDAICFREGNHLAVKNVFTRVSKEEGFAAIQSAIAERLASESSSTTSFRIHSRCWG